MINSIISETKEKVIRQGLIHIIEPLKLISTVFYKVVSKKKFKSSLITYNHWFFMEETKVDNNGVSNRLRPGVINLTLRLIN